MLSFSKLTIFSRQHELLTVNLQGAYVVISGARGLNTLSDANREKKRERLNPVKNASQKKTVRPREIFSGPHHNLASQTIGARASEIKLS